MAYHCHPLRGSDSLAGEQEVEARQAGIRQCGREAWPQAWFPYTGEADASISHWAGHKCEGTEPQRGPGGACAMGISNDGAWNGHCSWTGIYYYQLLNKSLVNFCFGVYCQPTLTWSWCKVTLREELMGRINSSSRFPPGTDNPR